MSPSAEEISRSPARGPVNYGRRAVCGGTSIFAVAALDDSSAAVVGVRAILGRLPFVRIVASGDSPHWSARNTPYPTDSRKNVFPSNRFRALANTTALVLW